MVRTYGHLCFRGVEESSLELGGSLKKGLLLGSCLSWHLRGISSDAGETPMRAELCRRSEGSTGWAGLDVKVRNLGLAWLGGFSPKLPAPEAPS